MQVEILQSDGGSINNCNLFCHSITNHVPLADFLIFKADYSRWSFNVFSVCAFFVLSFFLLLRLWVKYNIWNNYWKGTWFIVSPANKTEWCWHMLCLHCNKDYEGALFNSCWREYLILSTTGFVCRGARQEFIMPCSTPPFNYNNSSCSCCYR